MDNFWTFLTLIVVPAAAVLSSCHALLHKDDPRSAFGWIAFCVFLPILGPLCYLFFGFNRVKRRADILLKDVPDVSFEESPGQEECSVETGVPENFKRHNTLSCALSGKALTHGNTVSWFNNGEEAYPAMLKLIASAEERIYLTTYLFETGETGKRFMDALAAARKRGVEVKVIVDGIGEFSNRPKATQYLRSMGVDARPFIPPKLFPPSISINLRTHRKILVVDGHTAFTGGMNIGQHHLVQEPGKKKAADLHYKVRGEAAADIEDVFLHDWQFVSGESVRKSRPDVHNDGPSICRVLKDGPDEDIELLTLVLAGVVSAAEKRVFIMSPYFLPPSDLTTAMKTAALRGVDVRIALPQKNNQPWVHWATRNLLSDLLQHGVKIFYHPGHFPERPMFVHTKLLLVDEEYVQFGSANLDPRSLRLNFEMNLEVYDAALNEELSEHFRGALAHARPVTLQELNGRNLPERFRDALFWLFSPYL